MLTEEELKDSKLLIFANKQDLPGAFDEGQVSESLGLSELKDRQWSIRKCCAIKGEGLEQGLDWYVGSTPNTPKHSSQHCICRELDEV